MNLQANSRPSRPSRVRRRGGHLASAAIYLAATVAFGHELVLHLTTQTVTMFGDGFALMWDYWWAHKSLVELHTSPFHTTWLSYPIDASLIFHPLDLFDGVLTIPIQHLFPWIPGVILGTNLIVLGCFFFSAFAMYLAAWAFTRHWPAATIAGFAYSFCAFHFTRPDNPVVAAMYWPPLFTLVFWRAARRGGWWALLPGLCFGLCFFQSLYYTLFLALLSVFLSLFVLLRRPAGSRSLRHVITINMALATFALPFLSLAAADLSRAHYVVAGSHLPGQTQTSPEATQPFDDNSRSSIDVAGLVIPGPNQGLWRYWSGPWNAYLNRPTARLQLFGENGEGGRVIFVGAFPLLLAMVAWRRGPRRLVVPWSVCALLFLSLAMGPDLHVFGWIVHSGPLPLPYRLFLLVPARLSTMLRVPYYFFAPALFGLWMVAAFGVRWLLSGLRSRRGAALARVTLLVWLIVDYAAPQLRGWNAFVPPVYWQIATDARPAVVFALPMGDLSTVEQFSFYQTLHGKPMVRGFLSRIDDAVVAHDARIRRAGESVEDLITLLNDLGPTYIVVHKWMLITSDDHAMASLVASALAPAKFYEDQRTAAYVWQLSPPEPTTIGQPARR